MKLEEELSTEEILSQFVSSTKPNVFVVGSHRHGSLKRYKHNILFYIEKIFNF